MNAGDEKKSTGTNFHKIPLLNSHVGSKNFTVFFEGRKALSCSELRSATQTPKCATQALEKYGLQLG